MDIRSGTDAMGPKPGYGGTANWLSGDIDVHAGKQMIQVKVIRK